MAQPPQLELLSEIEYEHKSPDDYPKICPTLDLSATWDSDGRNILVYRPPSQVVSKIHQVGPPGEKAPEAVTASWKPDGQFLAVGWSDGFVRLMGLENNKAAHHIKVCENREVKITHIGWVSNQIDNLGSHKVPAVLRNGLLDEGIPMDLPRELTFLEIDTALPKISPLPSGSAGGGEDATVFTLRSGIEFLFQPPNPDEYDQVNVMVVGTSDGKLQLSIYDSFIIGSFDSALVSPSPTLQLLHHAAHPEVSTHALLLADKPSGPDEVHLVPMDLPFISSSPINLSLLSSKLTTMQKLLRYLKQTQLHMQVEWKNTRELPSRFLRSVEGDLEEMESGPKTIVPALYHTVLTGHAHEPVREWLVENLAERGHKRWDKAVVAGLEGLRSLVHENFLPALDRYAIILSRLRGLAQFHDTRDDIGFTATQISRLLDIVSCLSLVGHKILTHTMDELEHFTAFSTWLRFQIDRLATSSLSDELTEKEATMDTSKVLTYIERYLTSSPLSMFFDEVAKEDYTADWEHIENGLGLLDVLDQQLKKQESAQPGMKALTHADFLVDYATTWSNSLFKDIAEAKKRSVRFGKPVKLSLGHPITHKEIRTCKTKDNEMTIFTALTSKEFESKVYIFNTGISIVNGISTNLSTAACSIDISPRKLIDFKFLNDETLFILCNESNNTPKALSIPIHPSHLSYSPYDPSNSGEIPTVTLDGMTVYSFPAQAAQRPLRMEVFEKADIRGDIPTRICLLEGNKTTLRSFKIPQ